MMISENVTGKKMEMGEECRYLGRQRTKCWLRSEADFATLFYSYVLFPDYNLELSLQR